MGFNASALSANTIKTFVDRLNKRNKEKTTWPPKRSAVQEDIAKVLGYDSWHALNKALDTPKPDTLKNAPYAAPTQPPALEQWVIPNDYQNKDVVWDYVDWNKHCLVWGKDETRSDFFAQFAYINPSRPMLLIQGPLALPVDATHWASAQHIGQLRALMVADVDFSTASAQEIIKSLDLWNTSPVTSHSLELALSVCSALVELRDTQHLPFNLEVFVNHLTYDNVMGLAQRTDLDANTLHGLNAYLEKFDISDANLLRHATITQDWFETQETVNSYYYSKSANHRVLVSHLFTPSNTVKKQVEEYLDWWVSAHTGGLIMVDGLHSDSYFYEFLLRRLSLYKRDGVGVVIGCTNSGDFPNSQMYEQIQGRMGRCFSL